MFGSLAGTSATVGVGPSTHLTYSAAWHLWTQWRLLVVAVHRSVNLDMEFGEEAVTSEVVQCTAHLYFCCEGKLIPVAVEPFPRPSGNRIAEEAFHHKHREGRHCGGECTGGGASTDSAPNFVGC